MDSYMKKVVCWACGIVMFFAFGIFLDQNNKPKVPHYDSAAHSKAIKECRMDRLEAAEKYGDLADELKRVACVNKEFMDQDEVIYFKYLAEQFAK